MNETIALILIVGMLLATTAAFVWLALTVRSGGGKKNTDEDMIAAAEDDVDHIFNEDFREELRNRGRLHFENILNENAMFLQQDLRLTTSELNEYMKDEIKNVLKDEFTHYEQSINDAKDQAIESIQKTQNLIEEQRQVLQKQLEQQVEAEKQQIIAKFNARMGEIVNHYILEALAGELDISDQVDFIFHHLEANKQAIIEDIESGA